MTAQAQMAFLAAVASGAVLSVNTMAEGLMRRNCCRLGLVLYSHRDGYCLTETGRASLTEGAR